MTIIEFIAEPLFDISLLINAALYVIQIAKLIKTKNAANISLLTFVFFFLVLLIQALQAYYLADRSYLIGMIASLITSGGLIMAILYYRHWHRRTGRSLK